jgi:hypothetical protein
MERVMSQMGHERRFRDAWVMSAYRPTADIGADIRFRRWGQERTHAPQQKQLTQ